MNRCLGWVQLTQKKWKNHFCYYVNIFNHSFFGEKTSSLYYALKKRSILLFRFLSFPNFAFNNNNDFQFNIINEKTTDAKKPFYFSSCNVCVVNLKLRFRLPKIGPFNKQLGLVWTKTFCPSQRSFHFLFYFKRLPQILMAKNKEISIFFLQNFNFNAQSEYCLSIWCVFQEKDILDTTDMSKNNFSRRSLMHHSDYGGDKSLL